MLKTDHVDIRKLLLDSLHPALASISEEMDSEQSSLDRIRIVFNILEKEETLTNGMENLLNLRTIKKSF